jgi:YD repeat-containing protein
MRDVMCLVAALCITASVYAVDPHKFSPAEQEVLNVSKARMEASNRLDHAAWARYVAEDCIFSDDDGNVCTKAQVMEHTKNLRPGYDRSLDPRDFVVHVYGNTAVVNFRDTVHEQFGDSDIISEQRRTETFLKQNGSWLLIAVQYGNLPVNFRKPVAVDGSAYKDYVGQYQWRPGWDVDIVSVKNAKLWTHLGGDEEEEYFPLGSETFFVKDDLGNVTFVRDAQGHVTGYTYHRADGQEVKVTKIR